MIEEGVDVHLCGDMSLRFAAEKGQIGVCKVLLEYGADANALKFDEIRGLLRGVVRVTC